MTPSSGDKGRDIIATKPGYFSIRILDQVKAYSSGNPVRHIDVRAMLGVLSSDQNVSKGLITTTSTFEPGILAADEFKKFIPHRLDLKDGKQLLEWLAKIREANPACSDESPSVTTAGLPTSADYTPTIVAPSTRRLSY